MSLDSYTPPVSALLTYGDCRELDKANQGWADYPQQFGFTAANIPELIRLAIDPEINQLDSDRIEVWAPIHAWRTLAQLQAEAAIEPLISLFGQEDEWLLTEMPTVFSQIGAASIDALKDCLQDDDRETMARTLAADCLARIAQDHPDSREVCIQAIVHELEQFETHSEDLTTMLICNVLDLKLVEMAPLLEQVYASGKVDLMMTGTWAAVQVELGLKRREDFSPSELRAPVPEALRKIVKTIEAATLRTNKPQGFGAAPTDSPTDSKKKNKKKKK